jgi:antibiotic biosynthesis monooxygenase (ABM) superfamily enzyme
MKRVDHAFGSWFSESEDSAKPPSRLKTSVAVWLGLYPTVVVLTLALSPLNLPLWQGLLVGNLLSALAMSYLTMPHYVNPLLNWWLSPKPAAPQPATNLRGLILILAINAAWALVFYLLTERVWTPP